MRDKNIFKKIFKYFEPSWTGNDGKPSVRVLLAIGFSVDVIRNIHHAVYKWEVGRSLEGLALVLGIEAGLIAALLSLTTYQNIQSLSNVSKTTVEQSQIGNTATTTISKSLNKGIEPVDGNV